MKTSWKTVVAILSVWFLLAFGAAYLHLFSNGANRIGAAVGVAAIVPLVLFALWFSFSDKFRRFALSLNPRTITAVQVWRIIGFIFVLLEARNVLPAAFALPAGYGDMFIGATAAFVAWKFADSEHRGLFVLWQFLGIADLATAVSLGTTAFLLAPQGPSTVPMTVLPLSLIPTFLVPLFAMLHIICIAQARSWKSTSSRERSFTVQPQAI